MSPSYNDAIEAAITVVVKDWEQSNDPKAMMPAMLKLVGKLNDLRRPSRKNTAPHSLHRTTAPGA